MTRKITLRWDSDKHDEERWFSLHQLAIREPYRLKVVVDEKKYPKYGNTIRVYYSWWTSLWNKSEVNAMILSYRLRAQELFRDKEIKYE
jgi:hypothetical protein